MQQFTITASVVCQCSLFLDVIVLLEDMMAMALTSCGDGSFIVAGVHTLYFMLEDCIGFNP